MGGRTIYLLQRSFAQILGVFWKEYPVNLLVALIENALIECLIWWWKFLKIINNSCLCWRLCQMIPGRGYYNYFQFFFFTFCICFDNNLKSCVQNPNLLGYWSHEAYYLSDTWQKIHIEFNLSNIINILDGIKFHLFR